MRSSVRSARRMAALCSAALLVACATPAQRSQDSVTVNGTRQVDDRVRLAQLERDVEALVKTRGCDSAGSCRTAPVGWRGCGGPRTYVVYCAATTDSAALFRKLNELKEAEIAYNTKSGMMSTCEMRMPPTVSASGGSCRENR